MLPRSCLPKPEGEQRAEMGTLLCLPSWERGFGELLGVTLPTKAESPEL